MLSKIFIDLTRFSLFQTIVEDYPWLKYRLTIRGHGLFSLRSFTRKMGVLRLLPEARQLVFTFLFKATGMATIGLIYFPANCPSRNLRNGSPIMTIRATPTVIRSEERRVGKECRSRGTQYDGKRSRQGKQGTA